MLTKPIIKYRGRKWIIVKHKPYHEMNDIERAYVNMARKFCVKLNKQENK